MTLYEDLKKLEPFKLAFHNDADGIYSASLLNSIFQIKEIEVPPFGEYTSEVAIDLGKPLKEEWEGICIDHHPDHPTERKYTLYYDECPTGLIIYKHLKDYIPKDQAWKVVGALSGDGQPERVPDEIWDMFPILLEERGILTKSGFKVVTTAFPLFYFLSSCINAVSRLGFPERAFEIVNNAKGPLDILDNLEVKDALEQFRSEEELVYKSKPVVETIRNRYLIVKIKPSSSNVDVTSLIASKIAGENPGKTVIVINEATGKVSLRGLLAKYVSNKLATRGIKSGGHPGYCGAQIDPKQINEFLDIIRSLLV
ncbi:MAG: DHH family phosphoesterase [Ignisphaera sp.]